MTTLMDLSDEVIDIILSYSNISFEDIINFRCVCRKFRWAAKTEKYCFLKNKFYQRWSSAKKYYDEQSKKIEQKQSKENKQNDKKSISFIETGIDSAKRLRNDLYKKVYFTCKNNLDMTYFTIDFVKCLAPEYSFIYKNEEDLSDKYFSEEELSKLTMEKNLRKLMFKNKNYIILFFMDEIKHLLQQPVRVGCDLTTRYYYVILFDYLCLIWRNVVLERYSKEPCKELSEESATIWAQQLQLEKNISYSNVKASLKNITLEALNFLREKHPEHSIFSTPDELFSYWENNKINDNYWSETEGTQIIDTLVEYMFNKLKLQIIISKELKYDCIDYVLENKYGSDIILYIIYESVARRLGLRCDLVYISNSYAINLLWVPRYTFAANYRGNICLLDKEHIKSTRLLEVYKWTYKRFTNYSEFQSMYKKTVSEMLKSNLSLNTSMLSNITFDLESFMRFQTRSKDVKFTVGMIVTHGGKSTDCSTGVIIGWNQKDNFYSSLMDVLSQSIILKPFCDVKLCSNFNTTKQQTCYIILTKSDKLCCVKEDNIALTKPMWITNKNIYYYFSKFEGTHYVANERLKKLYPHDAAITAGNLFKG